MEDIVPESGMPIRVVVVDDEPHALAGLTALLGTYPQIAVVGSARDGEAAVATVLELRPQVVVMDVIMPGMDGIEATRRIKAEDSSIPVLLLTTYGAVEFDAKAAGADRILLKVDSDEEIVQTILELGGATPAP
jgi:DNA-binding NarL/FixJ family response regulator